MTLINASQELGEIKQEVLYALSCVGREPEAAFRFFNLCTASQNGPNARYVVLREFDQENAQLLIYTDHRSNKVKEIKASPSVSISAYNDEKRVQIKLTGEAKIHFHDKLADEHWKALSRGKEAYQTSKPPGTPMNSLEESHQLKNTIDDKYFAVISVKVKQLEVLQLRREGHIRAIFDFLKNEQSFLVP